MYYCYYYYYLGPVGLGFCVFACFFNYDMFVVGLGFDLVFHVFFSPGCCELVVSTNAIECLERLISKMTNYLLNSTHATK